jgi:hypothetical protein
MKSLICLCTALLADAGRLCSVETTRDLIEIKSRVQHEGVSFLTITLPDFATDFERGLELGRVDSTFFSGWKKRGCLPAFLQGFTSLVFGADGRILNEPDTTAVYCTRQICRVFKKIRLSCSKRRERGAFDRFEQIEAAFCEDYQSKDDCSDHFDRVASALWSGVFEDKFNEFALVPKHGPGATCERVSGNAKYAHMVWYERLESSFPATEHFFTNVNHMLDERHGLEKLTMIAPDSEKPVRVISVPKTLKAPRIIAIEPVCMQYAQQGVGRWITKCIQRSVLTKEAIRFDDQTVNQRMAISSSLNGRFSTIDLSDASDRVPLSMVERMLACNPELLGAVLACRSRRAELPNGTVLDLKKFASMGSALCFPIESMYFYTIIVHALLWKHKQPPTRRNLIKIANRVYIFGDDIIVPTGETDTVLEALAKYGCKVNTTKSFWRGKFRESCGADAFNGIDVTPIYLREMRPSGRRSTAGVVSWVATSNLFHEAGCWQTADFMKNEIEELLGKLPVIRETSPGLGWVSFMGIPENLRQCKYLHRPLVRTYKVQTTRVSDVLNGYPALLKYFLNAHHLEGDVLRPRSISKKHLASSVRCGTVSRKRHWVPAS